MEPLQILESSEGSEDESEIPSEGGPENAEPKRIEQKTPEALKAAVSSAPFFGEDEFPLPPLPPSPGLTAVEAQAFPSLQQTAVLLPLQKGICRTRQEGDLEAMTMAFPVTTTHGRTPPGTDPNNPNGVYEAMHRQIPFKILKELKQAVQNYGVNSPFTLGLVQGLAEGSHLIMMAHDQARQIPISLDQLIDGGNWGRTQDQVLMEDQAIEQVR